MQNLTRSIALVATSLSFFACVPKTYENQRLGGPTSSQSAFAVDDEENSGDVVEAPAGDDVPSSDETNTDDPTSGDPTAPTDDPSAGDPTTDGADTNGTETDGTDGTDGDAPNGPDTDGTDTTTDDDTGGSTDGDDNRDPNAVGACYSTGRNERSCEFKLASECPDGSGHEYDAAQREMDGLTRYFDENQQCDLMTSFTPEHSIVPCGSMDGDKCQATAEFLCRKLITNPLRRYTPPDRSGFALEDGHPKDPICEQPNPPAYCNNPDPFWDAHPVLIDHHNVSTYCDAESCMSWCAGIYTTEGGFYDFGL